MLARGELQTIGATTLDDYRKYLEKDAALEPLEVLVDGLAERPQLHRLRAHPVSSSPSTATGNREPRHHTPEPLTREDGLSSSTQLLAAGVCSSNPLTATGVRMEHPH
jgi:hypothetical protein